MEFEKFIEKTGLDKVKVREVLDCCSFDAWFDLFKSCDWDVLEYIFTLYFDGKVTLENTCFIFDFMVKRTLWDINLENMKDFVDKLVYFGGRFGNIRSDYAEALRLKMDASLRVSTAAMMAEEYKDKIEKLESQKKSLEDMIGVYSKDIGREKIERVERDQKKTLSIIEKKKAIDVYVDKKLDEDNSKCPSKYDGFIKNMHEVFEISSYSLKYGLEALSPLSILLILNFLVFVGLEIGLSSGMVNFIGIEAFLGTSDVLLFEAYFIAALVFIVSSFSDFILRNYLLKDKCDKYYDIKWLSEFRNYYLSKSNSKYEKLTINSLDVQKYLENIEKLKEDILKLDEQIEIKKEAESYFLSKKEAALLDYEKYSLKAELIFGKSENEEMEDKYYKGAKVKKLTLRN